MCITSEFKTGSSSKTSVYSMLSSSLRFRSSMRFGLARHFMNELKVDIIKDVRFKKANDMFQAMSVDLKRKELDRSYSFPCGS
jgi:hypothetical protein